jgi:hypothetical protein
MTAQWKAENPGKAADYKRNYEKRADVKERRRERDRRRAVQQRKERAQLKKAS